MLTLTLTVNSIALYLVVADVLALLTYILFLFHKKRMLEKAVKDITDFISDYFTHTGAEVNVTCFKLDGDRRFVTLIESQPLKRFRFSNILETNLITHIYKKTGNTVEKIYWRFPVAIQNEAIITEGHNTAIPDDLYFADAKATADATHPFDAVNFDTSPGIYKVSEASWDEFKSSK